MEEQIGSKVGNKIERTDIFPCPSCGANMVFEPASQMLVCQYCGHKEEIEKDSAPVTEHFFLDADENASMDWGDEIRVIHCENCGADTVLDKTTAAEFCAFCGSSHIIRNESSIGIAPESLIPFKISRKNAEAGFTKWIKHRFWAPRKLKTKYQAQKITGIYIPFWTYDADTRSTYTAEAGTYYYVTETEWVEENGEQKQVEKQVKKTRWEYTSGNYSRFFNDILINASKKVSDKLIRKIEPFDLSELTHYNPQYMSGFLAERYSVTLKEGWGKATPIMDDKIESGIKNQINADEIRNLNIDTGFYGVTYKHILLPVWVSAFIYHNKIYQYFVNGQTGEVQGKYPKSVAKIIMAVLLGLAALALIILIL